MRRQALHIRRFVGQRITAPRGPKGDKCKMETKYEEAAAQMAERLGIGVTIHDGDGRCPPWADEKELRGTCPRCKATHGDHYRIELTGPNGRRFESEYWNSYINSKAFADKENAGMGLSFYERNKPKRPGVYDVLSCIVSEATCPQEADEVAEEFGPMKPSRAEAIAVAARKAQRFFSFLTDEQMDELREVSA